MPTPTTMEAALADAQAVTCDSQCTVWARNCQVTVKVSDISEESADIIVCPTNRKLTGIGEVYHALLSKAGWELVEQAALYVVDEGEVETGHVAIVDNPLGSSLRCRSIAFAVGPTGCDSPDTCKAHLAQIVSEVLVAAEHLQVTSVAFSAVSTGLYGWEPVLVAEGMIDAIFDCASLRTVTDIRIVILDEHVASCFQTYLQKKE